VFSVSETGFPVCRLAEGNDVSQGHADVAVNDTACELELVMVRLWPAEAAPPAT